MKTQKEIKTLEYYLGLDYPITIYRAEEGGYVGEIEDLPGCITEGESLEEVTQRIEEARKAWIETAYEDGIEIPLPRTDEQYSGKFIVRIPRYLHRRLAEQATREGVSLNQYVGCLLSEGSSTKRDIKTDYETVPVGSGLRGKTIWYSHISKVKPTGSLRVIARPRAQISDTESEISQREEQLAL